MGRILVLSIVALFATTGLASASISYQYTADTSAIPATAVVGQSYLVQIYLTETLTSGSTSLINKDGGLYGYALALTASGGGSTINASTVSLNPAQFTGTNSQYTPTSGQVTSVGMIANVGNAKTGVQASATGTGTQILLATVDITAGAGSTTFSLTNGNAYYGSQNTITFNNLYDLDSTNNASNGGGATYTGTGASTFTFTVNTAAAVPEPSSMALCGLAIAGMGVGAWRRRKARLAAEAQAAEANPCA